MPRTERLLLTPVDASSVDDLVVLHRDPHVAYWVAGPWSRADAAGYAEVQAANWRDGGIGKWLAHDAVTGALVGRGGGSRVVLDGQEHVEIGWAVLTALRGRGYATEIGAATIRFARETLGIDGVVAFTEVHNVRSRAVMERLGLAYLRELRRPGLVAGLDGMQPDAPFALYATPGSHQPMRMTSWPAP